MIDVVRLNPLILNNTNPDGNTFGRLNYPKVLFELKYVVVREFHYEPHGKMIVVACPSLPKTLVLIKEDCIKVKF